MPTPRSGRTLRTHTGMHVTGGTAIRSTLPQHRAIPADHAIDNFDFSANHSNTIASLFSTSKRDLYRRFPHEADRSARGFERIGT